MIKMSLQMKSAKDSMKVQAAGFIKILLAFFLFSFIVPHLFAQDFPPPPNPPRLVNDFANILTPAERAALEQKLVAYDDSTSTQIAIVTIETLAGAEVGSYAAELG